MSGQQPEPRIVPPDEAQEYLAAQDELSLHFPRLLVQIVADLAHTAAVLGEQRDAALDIHRGFHWCFNAERHQAYTYDETSDVLGPCPTARALGVTP